MKVRGLLLVSLLIAGCLQSNPNPEPVVTADAGPPPPPKDGPKQFEKLLLPQYGHTIHLEVDAPEGYGPGVAAMEDVAGEISRATGKQVTFEFQIEDFEPIRNDSQQLYAAHEASFESNASVDGVVRHHVMFLPGEITFATEFGTGYFLGFASAGTPWIAVLYEALARNDDPLVANNNRAVERSIMVHELGHSLGLVGAPVPMVVDHSNGEGHSNSRLSVMTPALETKLAWTENVVDNVMTPWRFDDNDLADLQAFITANST